jgi:hypothetical protein
MSWMITIRTDKNIQEKDIDVIVSTLPKELSSLLGENSKQTWGWSCGVDIDNPKGNELPIGGASFSAHLSEPTVDYLKKALKKIGYKKVRSTKISW